MSVEDLGLAADDVFADGGVVGERMRATDWSRTAVGDPSGWPQSLRSMVRFMLASRYAMWMGWGPELTFFYNDAYAPTLGVKHPWAIGRPAAEVWREIWPDVGPLVEQVLSTGKATYNEGMLLFLERSGFPEETYHTFSYSPVFAEEGGVAGMFCVVVEETDRVISERRLATLGEISAAAAVSNTQAELFANVGEPLRANLRDLPFTLTYLFDDDGGARLTASSGVEPGHPAAPERLGPGDLRWPLERIAAADAAIELADFAERCGETPSGAWDRPVRSALIAPILQGAHGRAAGFFVAGLNPYRPLDPAYRNFVELLAGQIGAALANARAYDEERKRAEALAEIDRAKTAFFSNVSHEFRTPLTLMLGPLEEALKGAEGLPVHAELELAHRNGLRLLRLVNSLLDFSRIEAGRMQGRFEPTDLGAFSRDIASAFRSAVERAGLELKVETSPLGQPVYVDRDMWEKVLVNLLSNAFKFTHDGAITVDVRPSQDGQAAVVTVTDTGVGVPPEHLPKLFERFHRVEGAKGRSFEGTGIGLALVQELVKLHGGTIEVESAPGEGAAFTVRLPFGAAHLPAEHVAAGEASAAASTKIKAFVAEAERWLPDVDAAPAARAAAGALGDGRRVLLVDDNADMRDYVRRLLAAQGFDVECAEDGAEALNLALDRPPDLILTDVMMPVLDGFGLLDAVRGDPRLAETPVIMLSARAGEEARVEGMRAGADDYLVKPFAARELLARVTTNIQMAVLRREAARAISLSQERLQLAISTGRVAIYDWRIGADRLAVLGPLAEAFGVSVAEAAQGLPIEVFLAGIHAEDRDAVSAALRRTLDDGAPFEMEYRTVAGGQVHWVLSRGGVEDRGEERHFTGLLIDLTERRIAEEKLATMNRAAASVAGDLDLERVVQTVTDAGVQLTGAQFGAFFYNVLDEAGESYMLYTLSGVPREAFSKFPMPRNTAVFAPTFEGQGVVRSDDITKDPRYGKNAPRKGMPDGHLPVRSYLAVPVKSSNGEVLGGLFFGHSEAGRFSQASEQLLEGLAGQAAVAIDNGRLFQAAEHELARRRRAEAELQALNAALEQKVAEEVAERLKAEEALRQAQKMEAVGQLTGGVAHDFNNLLTVIMGGLDTIKRTNPGDETRIRRAADMAMQGAQRAASLTSRLLAFSRRQPLEPKALDVNALVRDMTDLLHRTLGEQIELEGVLAPRIWPVEVDQNQLESALLNLAVNARDAMPDGGKLTLETANTDLDLAYAATDAEVVPGQYVMIAVSDTGEGMPAEVLSRVFEPFFTTKDVGRGTGLGLSMVYGFVKQSGGHVTIYSEPGQGTTVKLYFPRHFGEATAGAEAGERAVPGGDRDEVILVVEDNAEVRNYSTMVLGELGYQVVAAEDADAGLEILKSGQRVDLLFTDVVLPGKSGRVLADAARELRPELKVLFTTGYSRNAIVHHGRLDPGVQLITKPFTYEQLATRVRDLLDRG